MVLSAVVGDSQTFFESVGQFFANVGDFIVSLSEDLVFIIDLGRKVIADIPLYFQCFPPAVLSIIITTFAVALIYLIVGRT